MVNRADQAKWQTMDMAGLDFETSGTNVFEDRVVTATFVEFHQGRRPDATNWTIDPGVPVPEEAAAIHGWTTERLQAEPDVRRPEDALYEIAGRVALWMGRRMPVVAMNAAFDLSMLESELARYGIPTLAERLAPKPVGPVLDPGVLDKKVDQYRPSKCDGQQKREPRCTCGAENRKLEGLCRHYGVPLVAAHSAESDAASVVRLARAIIAKKPEHFRGMTIGGLHTAQQGWRAEQQAGLKAHFKKVGKPYDDVCGEWPVHQRCRPVAVAPVPEVEGALL